MLIQHIGHSEFLITDRHGTRWVTDPYDDHVGYPVPQVKCDLATLSHGHGDHHYTRALLGEPIVLEKAGSFFPCPDVRAELIPCWHDHHQGAHRGANLLSVVTMDDLRICHCGDLGHVPDAELLRALGHVDILLLPVGGHYTIDAGEAAQTMKLIGARITIPMHYRTEYNASWPIAPAEDFLNAVNASQAERTPLDLLRVTAGDLSEQPRLALLRSCAGERTAV